MLECATRDPIVILCNASHGVKIGLFLADITGDRIVMDFILKLSLIRSLVENGFGL